MINVSVCIGSSCHLRGSYNVIQTFQHLIEENNLFDKINFKGDFCMKQCDQNGVTVIVDGKKYMIDPDRASEFFRTIVMAKID